MFDFFKIKDNDKGNIYDKYLITSNIKINSLNDLTVFGINKNFLQNYSAIIDECFYLPYINLKEKDNIKKEDWNYVINKYNFREKWDFNSDKKKIGFFGCSFTFGEGLLYDDTFVSLVSKNNNLNPFNFGVGGSSLHRIARTFIAVTKIIKLDYAIFTLPHWNRQIFIDNKTGDFINLIPQWGNKDYLNINEKLTSLNEKHYIIQAISLLMWINDIAESKNIKIYFSSWEEKLNNLCKKMYPDKHIDKFICIENDYARDALHPGKKSHLNYAEKINKKLNFSPPTN